MERSLTTSVKGLVLAGLLMASAQVQAAPLGFTLNQFPDILSSFIAIQYDAGTDQLTANGFALQLRPESGIPVPLDAPGQFNLAATIDDAGNLVSGNISITGTIASLGFTTGTLLTGTLTDFGFDTPTSPFEFLFDVTGGDLAADFGAKPGGTKISQIANFSGNFSASFSNAGSTPALADTAPVPVPAALWLMLTAIAGLAAVRRQA